MEEEFGTLQIRVYTSRAQLPIEDATVEHPGYTALRVDGVQIFSGEETDQDMELIPLAEGQHSLVDSSILNTSPQNL